MSTTLASVAGPTGPRLIAREGGRLYDIAAGAGVGDLGELFRRGPEAVDAVRAIAGGLGGAAATDVAEADLTFLPPVANPSKIICVGLNYRRHAQESGAAVPTKPVLFAKFPNTLVGHGAPIVYTKVTEQLDYEGELGVIIGRRASGVAVRDALDYVGAYTIVDDVSARDLQFGEPQWIRGKSLDMFAPIGPYAVLPDAGFDPATFWIRTTVSGELRQDMSCSDMVFSVAEIITFISEAITLEPGDIISTWIPSGVGLGFKPLKYISPGDTVSVEIERIGVLTNPVVAA
jgi:2-keto-4-pentenoate hydratase/2-oxohepta-3-ene-1,7-dioic acid hydratase in catechol pathway